MPIYEYQTADLSQSCPKCRERFEVLQLKHVPLESCHACGAPVRKVVSRFLAALVQPDESGSRTETAIKDYERQGKWSHAAELAEKQSSKVKDASLRDRAFDNYKKAGYRNIG